MPPAAAYYRPEAPNSRLKTASAPATQKEIIYRGPRRANPHSRQFSKWHSAECTREIHAPDYIRICARPRALLIYAPSALCRALSVSWIYVRYAAAAGAEGRGPAFPAFPAARKCKHAGKFRAFFSRDKIFRLEKSARPLFLTWFFEKLLYTRDVWMLRSAGPGGRGENIFPLWPRGGAERAHPGILAWELSHIGRMNRAAVCAGKLLFT